jgi:hypothetical protein
MPPRISIPAVTREMEFIAHNAVTADEILEKESETTLAILTDTVYARADSEVDYLLRELELAVSSAIGGVVRLNWVNTSRGLNWASWGKLYSPRGPLRRIGSAGLWLDHNLQPLRLIGWIWPRWGGLDGRREVVRLCRKKMKSVCLPHEHPKQYKGWKEDDGVVWFDEQLGLRTSLDGLGQRLAKDARRFFKLARPVLQSLVDR